MRGVSELSATTGKRAGATTGIGVMPGKSGSGKKPPAPVGFEFYKQGAGWACRSVLIEDGRRVRRYVGYLSGKAWAELQAAHKGPELRAAIRQWIEGRRK